MLMLSEILIFVVGNPNLVCAYRWNFRDRLLNLEIMFANWMPIKGHQNFEVE
jgi:hypothetical protein